jgi:hypothetical protein
MIRGNARHGHGLSRQRPRKTLGTSISASGDALHGPSKTLGVPIVRRRFGLSSPRGVDDLSRHGKLAERGSHPLTPFAFGDEFVPGNGKNRP